MDISRTPDQSLAGRLTARIETLRAEFALGERRMAALEVERREVRDTLLRISGALQVLQEELGTAPEAAPMGEAGHVSEAAGVEAPRLSEAVI